MMNLLLTLLVSTQVLGLVESKAPPVTVELYYESQ